MHGLTKWESDDHLRGVGAVGGGELALVLELVVQGEEVLRGGADGVLLHVLEAVLVLTEVVGHALGLGGAELLSGVPAAIDELRKKPRKKLNDEIN